MQHADAAFIIPMKLLANFWNAMGSFRSLEDTRCKILDLYKNRGAVIKYKDEGITIRQFNSSRHPYWLPKFIDVFTWSLPFVGAKITEMLLAILAICSEEELTEDAGEGGVIGGETGDTTMDAKQVSERREEIKAKVLAVGKINRVFKVLRQESENATELSSPDAPVEGHPPGSWPTGHDGLGVHVNQIRSQIRSFDDARKSDRFNERVPRLPPVDLPHVPAPSMRIHRADDSDPDGSGDLGDMIRKALEDEGFESVIAERLADKIALADRGHSKRPRRD
ncbi:hypothetical protein NLI96_g2144 [Meripilus lineatus]|uniref:Uncharacterized protein n=1 Tax=Meripilus lineatus TaxID=2056292 RepID=A0AAD5VDN5_9APHY|nr:hypothetical protein NLI96_g2144 [Physisporinus lineatus]